MRKGFIFKESLCVNCKACVAACLLENKWDIPMRSLYVYNSELRPSLPVINLSLACNHCTDPVCQTGCPSKAIYKNIPTGAVIIESSKCLGCNYCKWNCPYEAPRVDLSQKVAQKCNLCFELVSDGKKPACASGCPTGALDYSEIMDFSDNSEIKWFPDKGLNPAIEIKQQGSSEPLRIIPSEKFSDGAEAEKTDDREINSDWSLIGFTFLSMLSVSLTLKDFFSGKTGNSILSLWLIIIAGTLSIFHLGKKARAWRAVFNVFRSPLSMEITAYILYVVIISFLMLFNILWLKISATVIGIILMLTIDQVYNFTGRNGKYIIHSGQVFLSMMITSSYLSGFMLPFLFLAIVKLLLLLYFLVKRGNRHWSFGLRFIRIVLLIVSSGVMISGSGIEEKVFILLFITGEFADRIIFYADFNPVNINNSIADNIKISLNEKKRS